MYKNRVLFRYLFQSYKKSNKYILPILVLAIYMGFSYTIAPLGVLEGFTMSAVCVAGIMTWIGWTYNEAKNPAEEQLLILKAGSERRYYMVNLCVLAWLGILVSALAVVVPVVQHMVNHFSFFNRSLGVKDVAAAFLLHVFAAYMGGITGAFCHPRIMQNRKMAALATSLYLLMGIVKIGILDEFPMSRFYLWIFLPIAEFVEKFVNEDYFQVPAVAGTVGLFVVYSLVLSVLNTGLLVKNKF